VSNFSVAMETKVKLTTIVGKWVEEVYEMCIWKDYLSLHDVGYRIINMFDPFIKELRHLTPCHCNNNRINFCNTCPLDNKKSTEEEICKIKEKAKYAFISKIRQWPECLDILGN